MANNSPDFLNTALDVLDAGIVVLDSEQHVTFWNGWMSAASGVSKDEAFGKSLSSIFSDPPPARLTSAISDAFTLNSSSFLTHSLNRILLPLRTRAGLEMIQNISVRPIGDIIDRRCLLQITDVTAMSHRERILRERQNARYDAVVASAPDVILTIDALGIAQSANPATFHEMGYEPQDIIGRNPSFLFDDSNSWEKYWRGALESSTPIKPVELVARRKDGSLSYLEASASRWLSSSHVFITTILRDTNDRRAAEGALRALNATLETRVAERTQERDQVWKVSRDMLGVASESGVWISVNPAWQQVLGWIPAEITGRTSEWLEHPADVLRNQLGQISKTEAAFEFENRLRRRDGEYRSFSWTAVNADGLLFCVARDTTEQKRQQDALLKAEDALRQAQKMEAVGQLTGGLAHDFNNLLTGISGSLELLQIRISQARYKDVDRYIAVAKGATNRAASLTHRLLAFSRRQTLDPKSTDANRLVFGMTELINNTLGPGIELQISYDENLWNTLVDPNQLENALLNLCINARDAMPDGGRLQIKTTNFSLKSNHPPLNDLPSGDYVRLDVSDTGTGMTEEVLQRAFDPFYTTKPLGEGTGLGLSMIYGFAKQSGGQVSIASTVGQGTSISLYLPRHDQEEALIEKSTSNVIPRASAGETVLIVDDEPSVRMLVTEVLSDLGYTAIEAADGVSALRVLQSDVRIDLLVTDVGLPSGMNGRQLADFGRVARPKLKVLFITGYAEKSVMADGNLDKGMGILAKPFAIDGLAARIKDLISQS
jgi:PAS domain S-box-containing protein